MPFHPVLRSHVFFLVEPRLKFSGSIVASPEKGFKKHERKNNVYMVFFVRLDKQNFTSFS